MMDTMPLPEIWDDPGLWWLNLGRRLIEQTSPVMDDAQQSPEVLKFLRLREYIARAGRPVDLYLVDPPQGMPADCAKRIRQGKPMLADIELWHRLVRVRTAAVDPGWDDES
jgi:hypothetical protein